MIVIVCELLMVLFLCIGNLGRDINSLTAIGGVHRELPFQGDISEVLWKSRPKNNLFSLASHIAVVMSVGLKLQTDVLGKSQSTTVE